MCVYVTQGLEDLVCVCVRVRCACGRVAGVVQLLESAGARKFVAPRRSRAGVGIFRPEANGGGTIFSKLKFQIENQRP